MKLLVGDVSGHQVTPVLETSRQTRLGAGLYRDRTLEAGRISATADAVRELVQQARGCGVVRLKLLATSAAREARNQRELLHALEAASGLRVEVLSGEQEARWAFRGATSDPRYSDVPLLLVEVGGGSTQFIAGHRDHLFFGNSFHLGTVRALERFPPSDPPTPVEWEACAGHIRQFLASEILPVIGPALVSAHEKAPFTCVAAGGTASILGCLELGLQRFDRGALEAVRLTPERLEIVERQLWSLTLEQRRTLPGLPANRADVILTGTSIYAAMCELFGFAEVHISTRGLRFAALMDELEKG